MKYGYVGWSSTAGSGYGGDPADVMAQEANRRSLDMDPPQELVSFSVRDVGRWYVVDAVFRWSLEPSSADQEKNNG